MTLHQAGFMFPILFAHQPILTRTTVLSKNDSFHFFFQLM